MWKAYTCQRTPCLEVSVWKDFLVEKSVYQHLNTDEEILDSLGNILACIDPEEQISRWTSKHKNVLVFLVCASSTFLGTPVTRL